MTRTYIAIDLKSFFASVECVERKLDPLTTNLVVADISRTEKTICLAVSPSLKSYGIGGRARLFEVVQKVKEINLQRSRALPDGRLKEKSVYDEQLRAHPDWAVDYIVAPPRMSYYIKYSTEVYRTYLKYIAPEDIHVYSIDEVFIDATSYLGTYHQSAHELAMTMIRDVLKTTGITATAGIGTNLYLAKIAMDIVAKHIPADSDGVRIAQLDEMSYRRQLWGHKPLTSFWMVGKGTAARLSKYGIQTMGDIARQSVVDEELFYKLFGVHAELLIDHAWGYEPCTISQVKAYRPHSSSLSSGQVLSQPYSFDKALVVIKEMAQNMALSLLDKRLVTNQIVMDISFDTSNLSDPHIKEKYQGETVSDHYGRPVPKGTHGSENLDRYTCSAMLLDRASEKLFRRIGNPLLLVRRLNLTVSHVIREEDIPKEPKEVQLSLFSDNDELELGRKAQEASLQKERQVQEAVLRIRKQFGKNAILKGLNFSEGATAISRNGQIGGHKA